MAVAVPAVFDFDPFKSVLCKMSVAVPAVSSFAGRELKIPSAADGLIVHSGVLFCGSSRRENGHDGRHDRADPELPDYLIAHETFRAV